MKRMRLLAVALILAACSTAPVAPKASVDPAIVEFLLTSAANDFHAHRPPAPARFRNVRIGHKPSASGAPQYMMCGEFQTAQSSEWVPFATIKTSGYEQWIGGQSDGYCSRVSIVWDDAGDLSAELLRRLEVTAGR